MADENGRRRWWEQYPSYSLAYEDIEFLNRDELRPVRLQLELLKPEMILSEHNIRSTIVVFGGTRIIERSKAESSVSRIKKRLEADPGNRRLKHRLAVAKSILAKAHYYEDAKQFAAIVSRETQKPIQREFVIVTGGGPGIMEAANRGAHESRSVSIGFNIVLPHEQYPNRYVTRDLCFRFRYFAIRKLHFLLRAKALVAFPGGFGTLDELFEALTLVQTRKVRALPIILYGTEYWKKLVDFDFMVSEGSIDPDDLKLFKYADSPEDAWRIIREFYEKKTNSFSVEGL